MKKFILLFAGILMLASCTQEGIISEEAVQNTNLFAKHEKAIVSHKNANEKEVLKELKADIVELKKNLSKADGNGLLQEFNRFKSFENQNDYEINNYDEALFMFTAQISPDQQELIITNFCDSETQNTICLPDSELTRQQLEFQVVAAITYALKDMAELSEAEILVVINSLSQTIKSKMQILSSYGYINLGYMFEFLIYSYNLTQNVEYSVAVVSASNTAISSMARNIKG